LIFGKPDRQYMANVIYRRLGARRPGVLIGPSLGVDNAVVKIVPGKVAVITADPLSFIPALGPSASAWLSVNLLASDLTTSGFSPQYGVFDFNLPPTMSHALFTDYWKCFDNECKNLGLAIIGGHTGRYQGCDYTVIGGGTMWAIGPQQRYVVSSMGRPGDDLILTKGAAIETTAVMTRVFPVKVRKAIGPDLFEKASKYLNRVSTVRDALAAASVGVRGNGVTAMHDATEGGVIAAVLELAYASKLGVEVFLPEILVATETEEICKLFHIDPLISLSEGSLVVACEPTRSSRILRKLKEAGLRATVVGRLTRGHRYWGFDRKGVQRVLHYPKFDPYWRAYWKAQTKHWK